MKHGICITYDYDGDEAEWEALVGGFVESIAADSELAGKFSYHVQKAKEGPGRIHIGRWDSPETVQLMQSRAYFKAFAPRLQALAGESLRSRPFTVAFSTD